MHTYVWMYMCACIYVCLQWALILFGLLHTICCVHTCICFSIFFTFNLPFQLFRPANSIRKYAAVCVLSATALQLLLLLVLLRVVWQGYTRSNFNQTCTMTSAQGCRVALAAVSLCLTYSSCSYCCCCCCCSHVTAYLLKRWYYKFSVSFFTLSLICCLFCCLLHFYCESHELHAPTANSIQTCSHI